MSNTFVTLLPRERVEVPVKLYSVTLISMKDNPWGYKGETKHIQIPCQNFQHAAQQSERLCPDGWYVSCIELDIELFPKLPV